MQQSHNIEDEVNSDNSATIRLKKFINLFKVIFLLALEEARITMLFKDSRVTKIIYMQVSLKSKNCS